MFNIAFSMYTQDSYPKNDKYIHFYHNYLRIKSDALRIGKTEQYEAGLNTW